MKRNFTSILVIVILISLFLIVIYESRNPDTTPPAVQAEFPEPVNDTSEEESAPEVSPESTTRKTDEISQASITEEDEKDNQIADSEPDLLPTTEDEPEDEEGFPTLSLVAYEGPVVVSEGQLCYYRVRAIASGDPYPAIRFSRDDSSGAWGRNIAQINLGLGQSYTLVVTATNTSGTETKSITLTWAP